MENELNGSLREAGEGRAPVPKSLLTRVSRQSVHGTLKSWAQTAFLSLDFQKSPSWSPVPEVQLGNTEHGETLRSPTLTKSHCHSQALCS